MGIIIPAPRVTGRIKRRMRKGYIKYEVLIQMLTHSYFDLGVIMMTQNFRKKASGKRKAQLFGKI